MHIIRVELLLAGWHQALLLYLLRYVIDLVAIPGLIITININMVVISTSSIMGAKVYADADEIITF